MKGLLELLTAKEYFGVSENIEIAKGKYSLPNGWKNVWYKIKRHSWQIKQ